MKVRIGVSLTGTDLSGPRGFAAQVDELEERGVDSLWLSELVYSPLVDPFVGMAYALSRTTRLKVGTGVAVLPGRSPVLVAKALASLAGLAPKRVLPVFGLAPARPAERAAFPVPPGQRGAVFDESLELVRRLLREPRVTFAGEFFQVEDASVGELPVRPLDIWLGGSAPAGLRGSGGTATAGWPASSPPTRPRPGSRPSGPRRPRRAGASRRTTTGSASRSRSEICPRRCWRPSAPVASTRRWTRSCRRGGTPPARSSRATSTPA